jgi:hypothetical protein
VTEQSPTASAADEDATPWVMQAACLGLAKSGEEDPWFPVAATSALAYAEAREVCVTCPVLGECLEQALNEERGRADGSRWGMWGGKTPKERARIEKAARERERRSR